MAKRDHTQGFYFIISKAITIGFLKDGEVVYPGKEVSSEEIADDTLRNETETLLINAMEMLESGYHDSRNVLDILIEELIDLQKKTK